MEELIRRPHACFTQYRERLGEQNDDDDEVASLATNLADSLKFEESLDLDERREMVLDLSEKAMDLLLEVQRTLPVKNMKQPGRSKISQRSLAEGTAPNSK